MAGMLSRLPFFVVLMLVAAGAMMVPAAYAVVTEDFDVARDFFYSGLVFGIAALLIGMAAQNSRRAEGERRYLATLFLAYLWLPAMLAVPLIDAVGNTRFINLYVEMISALTTTGAPFFDPERLAPAVHVWRGTVGWFGGLLIWITAAAVLAPLNLGGYEVTSEANIPGQVVTTLRGLEAASAAGRLRKYARRLVPIYLSLTVILTICLTALGQAPMPAFIHAMSVMATSGISPGDGLVGAPSGAMGEVVIFAFLFFALSRRVYTSGFGAGLWFRLRSDREVRLALVTITVLPTLLFLRHWIGAFEIDDLANPAGAFTALWGGVFTVLSFLTTTGFVSDSWAAAQSWSGLPTPGLLLMGLAVMGGGVATTAGGVKLLRVYSLYKHGSREIGKLLHPHSVAGAGRLGRRIRREGAYIAWVFFMLFILSLAAVMVGLSATGLDFETALILGVSALSTTGPLAGVAAADPISFGALSDPAKMILAVAMIVGRIETLVLIALLNPSFWRA